MGRKIKKAITVVIAGMIIGSQFAVMSAVGSSVQAEAGDHREAEKETESGRQPAWKIQRGQCGFFGD